MWEKVFPCRSEGWRRSTEGLPKLRFRIADVLYDHGDGHFDVRIHDRRNDRSPFTPSNTVLVRVPRRRLRLEPYFDDRLPAIGPPKSESVAERFNKFATDRLEEAARSALGGYVVAKGHCPLQKPGRRVGYATWLEYGGRLRVALTDSTEYGS